MACKNKEVVVVVNRNPSAFARHQEQQANAEREIKVSRKFCDANVFFPTSFTRVIVVVVLSLTEAKDEFLSLLGRSVAAHAAKKGFSKLFL